LAVRVLASPAEARCFQISAHLASVLPVLPLLSDTAREAAKKSVEAIVNYMLARLSKNPSEAQRALDLAMAAIASNKEVTLKSLDLAKAAIDKAAEDQRPAARAFAAPIGRSVSTATIGEQSNAFIVDEKAREAIEDVEPTEIGPAQPYTVSLSELDVATGACKLTIFGDDSDERYPGTITDPVVQNPRSPYSAALDSQGWLKVIAKPHLREGQLEKLTISDTSS
jgi:hypothetical protein